MWNLLLSSVSPSSEPAAEPPECGSFLFELLSSACHGSCSWLLVALTHFGLMPLWNFLSAVRDVPSLTRAFLID